jgi:RimJ/RimL family protein N-acetyltransferase
MLKGERVDLRPLKENDFKNFLKWFNDMEVTRYLISHLPVTEASEKKSIQEITAKREPVFVIETRNEQGRVKAIGVCGLHCVKYKDGNADMGITIGEKNFLGTGFWF